MKWLSVMKFVHIVNWQIKIYVIPTHWLRYQIIKAYCKFTKWRLDTVRRLKDEVIP